MDGVTIGNLIASIALGLTTAKIVFTLGRYSAEIHELKRDQDIIGKKFDDAIKSLHETEKRFITLLDSLSKGLISKSELDTLLVHYNAEVSGSHDDRKALWARVDDIIDRLASKQDRPHGM